MRYNLLLGFVIAQNEILSQGAPECEISYTQEQIDFASQAGQDTSHWKVTLKNTNENVIVELQGGY